MFMQKTTVMVVTSSIFLGAVLGFNLTNELTINSNLNGHKRISGAMLKHQVSHFVIYKLE